MPKYTCSNVISQKNVLLQEADSDPTGEAAEKTQQLLTYYELDLGLNHVVRKYSEQLDEHANFLVSGIEGQYQHVLLKPSIQNLEMEFQ